MPAGVEAVFEDDQLRQSRPGRIHVALEINARCPWAMACKGCILLEREVTGEPMAEEEVREAARELMWAARRERGINLAGMEPLSSPDLLFDILRDYHAAPPGERPASINMVTSGVGLSGLIDRFRETPLSRGARGARRGGSSTGRRPVASERH